MVDRTMTDAERNRLGGRVRRYAKVGAEVGGFAVWAAGSRLFGLATSDDKLAKELRRALGGLKGPIMKVAQMLATIPDFLPADYAAELAHLQTNAPPMGWPFVRRRMTAELGADWQNKFGSFDRAAAAAASLGQVHHATDGKGRQLACKLQYPDMQSVVEADLSQLKLVLAIHRRLDAAIDTTEIAEEIGARLREELDYVLEARHMRLYQDMLAPFKEIHIPETLPDLSTPRLLTMSWLEGKSVLAVKDGSLDIRNHVARNMFRAWWHPFCRYGAIHGDPHLGNYTVRDGDHSLNLFDFGCIRTFRPSFVKGVVDLYRALQNDDRDLAVSAYETWGFRGLSRDLMDVLNIWAAFIYGPLLDDRVRSIADGIEPGDYGRREAYLVHTKLRELGPVTLPREFVFMDRAAIGLGAVFLHLRAELNFHELFNNEIEGFDVDDLGRRQETAFMQAGVPLPT